MAAFASPSTNRPTAHARGSSSDFQRNSDCHVGQDGPANHSWFARMKDHMVEYGLSGLQSASILGQWRARVILSHLDNEHVTPSLLDALWQQETRKTAMRLLYVRGRENAQCAVPVLTSVLRDITSEYLRTEPAYARCGGPVQLFTYNELSDTVGFLAWIRAKEALPAVMYALRAVGSKIFVHDVGALAEFEGPEKVSLLVQMLASRSAPRSVAIRAIRSEFAKCPADQVAELYSQRDQGLAELKKSGASARVPRKLLDEVAHMRITETVFVFNDADT